WVFQELLLSPRVILFGRNEILWQCLLEVQNQYCNLELTVASDKLAALSGVANLFSKKIGSVYLAGLWRSHLPGCLMWT
ncbi:hypothetical protein DL95DRAFT_241791, partial [Leptodontidium sp. 2 PMI_412]